MTTNKLIQLLDPENPQTLVTSSLPACLLAWSNQLSRAEFPFSVLPDTIFVLTLIISHLDSSINLLSPFSASVSLLSQTHRSHCQPISFKNTNLFMSCSWNILWSLHCLYSLVGTRLSTIHLWCIFLVSPLPLFSMYSMLLK